MKHALISCIYDIFKFVKSNRFSCSLFLDLRRPVRWICSNILLKIHYGSPVHGIANSRCQDYLTGSVSLNATSHSHNINTGVTQEKFWAPHYFEVIWISDQRLSRYFDSLCMLMILKVFFTSMETLHMIIHEIDTNLVIMWLICSS